MSDALVLHEPTVAGNRHEVAVGDRTLWYEFDEAPERANIGAAAVALLPHAMNTGVGLHINGAVEREFLAGLEEFRDYWSLVLPSRFRHVPITADEVTDTAPRKPGAMAAYSGGVDATFQLVANVTGLLGARSLPIRGAVLIHGLDVPRDDHHGFQAAVNSARPILQEFGVPLRTVRTNWRDFCPDWEVSFAAAICSVLHHYSDTAGYGLVASDESYDLEVRPWGSNSSSNPLLGAGSFRIRSDGGGYGRTARVAAVGASPAVRENVRVCWQGRVKGSNCKRCEKCTRTQLNFLAAGHGVAEALGEVDVKRVAALRVRNQVQLSYLQDIQRYALPADLTAALATAIRRSQLRLKTLPARRALGPVEKRVKRLLR